jgi:hypothetical protein
MAKTYEPIATTTLGGAQNSVTFSTISGSYTDLIIIVDAAASALTELDVRVGNGSVDSGNNYSSTILTGSGSSAGSFTQTPTAQFRLNYNSVVSTTLGNTNHIFNFMNYSNTSTFKTVLYRGNSAGNGVDASVGLWRSTSAINTITLYANIAGVRTFSIGSTFTLYGILKA